jgi:opacity protein-like surface antigen
MRHVALVIVTTAALLFSSSAIAQAYAGLGAGPSKIDACSGLSDSCNGRGVGSKVFGGYKFLGDIAGELGYYSFGNITTNLNSIILGEAKVTGSAIGVAYLPQLSKYWGASLRLGAIRLKTKLSLSGSFGRIDDSYTTTSVYYGIGVNCDVARGVKLELGADFSRAGPELSKASMRALSLGVRTEF